jgi:hypothetical protein
MAREPRLVVVTLFPVYRNSTRLITVLEESIPLHEAFNDNDGYTIDDELCLILPRMNMNSIYGTSSSKFH